MKKFIIALLTIIAAVCTVFAVGCGGNGETYSTLEMNSSTVYLTDFSVKYTSDEESPYGDISESSLEEEKSGSVQSYYLVMNFDIQMATDNTDKEWLTVELTAYDASVVDAVVNYANTSSTSAVTENGQTIITAKFSLPDKARYIKAAELVVELKPQTEGITDIFYEFTSDTKSVTGYESMDTTVEVTSDTVSLSKTSLSYTLNKNTNHSVSTYMVSGIGTKKGGNIVVRSTFNGLQVTQIGDSALKGKTSITGITIPDSVTSIGDSAFSGCTSLTSITIGDSVTSIGESAFSDCTSLTNITMGSGVTTISESMFSGCTALESVSIPDNVTTISSSAFSDCTSLASITIGNGVTSIAESAFENTAYINDENNWQSGVLYIGACLIKAKSTISGDYAIKDGTNLIAGNAFDGCTSLAGVDIADSVTIICTYAFNECTSLATLTIGEGVTDIGRYSFSGCTALTEINFNATAANDLSTEASTVTLAITINGKITTVVGNEVFCSAGNEAEGITVNIGANVTKIPAGLFCPRGYAFSSSVHPKITNVVFKNGSVCETIGENAFCGCSNMTDINIPDSVKSIGDYAFYECSQLTSATIPDGVTSIGDIAFAGCDLLTSVTIPGGVEAIGDSAFVGCASLAEVIISEGVTKIGDQTFRNCKSLTKIVMPSSLTKIGENAFNGCTSLAELNIGSEVTSIGYAAFRGCISLTEIVIPENLVTICDCAFYECTSLTSVTFVNTSNWYVTPYAVEDRVRIDVTDASRNAANFLSETYGQQYWVRRDS